jgi:hypothetical protein
MMPESNVLSFRTTWCATLESFWNRTGIPPAAAGLGVKIHVLPSLTIRMTTVLSAGGDGFVGVPPSSPLQLENVIPVMKRPSAVHSEARRMLPPSIVRLPREIRPFCDATSRTGR